MNLKPLISRETWNHQTISFRGTIYGVPKSCSLVCCIIDFLHTAQVALEGDLENETEEDAVMNEFLSRFVWIMRGKLAEKWKRIGLQEMSGFAVAFSSENFSEDLWRTVREWHDFREGIWKLLSATFEGIFNATIFGVVVLQVCCGFKVFYL
ncbi:hypothetical protein LIER_17742 [Lithospermum erythrorhizon]|uniref:Uncharacterized protein n=1 Tax=Lithospermum erythrorhizon TaxID=34254 RepID=A0AAV3QFW0_LITER